jgi:tetratricopeptide (TPR) repeat protein
MKRKWMKLFDGVYIILLSAAVCGHAAAVFEVRPQKLIVDPQSEGVGENILAFPDAPGAMLANPGASAMIYQSKLSLMEVSLPQNVKYRQFAIQFPTEYGNFGGCLAFLNYGDDVFFGPGGASLASTDSGDITAVFNYALPLRHEIPYPEEYARLGVNLKYLRSTVGDYTDSGVAADIGASYRIPFIKHVTAGLVYRNMGTSLEFADGAVPLISEIEAGFRYDIPALADTALFVGAGRNVTDNLSTLSAGLAISPLYPFTFRAGWKDTGSAAGSGFRGGVGIDLGTIGLQYAFAPYARGSETVHFAGIEIAFGRISDEKRAYNHFLRHYFLQAKDKYERKDYLGARQQLEDILSIYPDDELSKEYLEKIGQALDDIEQQKEIEVSRWLRRATVAISGKDYLRARKSYESALILDPENTMALDGLDQVTQLIEEMHKKTVRKDNTDTIKTMFEEAVGYYQHGEYVTAKEKFESLLTVDPENEMVKKYINEIEVQLAKVTAIQINNLFVKGMDLYNKADYREAMKYFSAVAIASPDRIDAQDYLAKCQNILKEEEEKLNSEEEAQRREKIKDEVSLSFEQAHKLYENGNYEEALKAFARSREIAARYDYEHYVEESRNYIVQSKNAISDKHYKIGFEYAQKNKIESAAYEYRKALEYNSENTLARSGLDEISSKLAQDYYEQGMYCFSKGDTVKAKEYFKKSLYYKPDKIESLRAIERIR